MRIIQLSWAGPERLKERGALFFRAVEAGLVCLQLGT